MTPSGKITLRLDTSQIVQALKCPTYHDFVSVQNLMKKGVDRKAMDRGTVMHGLLQRYYQKIWEGDQWASALNYAISQLIILREEVKLPKPDTQVVLMRFNDYVVKHYNERLKIATLTKSDGTKGPALEVGFSKVLLDTPDYYFVLEGRIDMIALMSECNVIWDHKCQARQYYLYGHSIQMLNYAFAADTNYTMYNYVRLHQKIQPNTFVRSLKFIPMWLKERWREKLISYFRIIAVNRDPNWRSLDFPNQSCSDIGFGKTCPFTMVCEEQSPRVQKQLIEQNYIERKQWLPWALEEGMTEEENEND